MNLIYPGSQKNQACFEEKTKKNSLLTIVKVNATVKRRHIAFSLTNGRHGLFVGVEGIFKANWSAPPAGGALRLVLQTFYPQEGADATFERRRADSSGTLSEQGPLVPQHCREDWKEPEHNITRGSKTPDFQSEDVGIACSEQLPTPI